MSCRSPMESILLLVQIGCYPAGVARLVEKKEETTVFPVLHDQRPLAKVMGCFEVLDQGFKFFPIVAVDTHGLLVPIDPERHKNTINRYGVDGSA